jgi:hypothetical protein
MSHQGKFLVMQPGRAVHECNDSKEAIEQLVKATGYAKIYAPNGRLLFTKGTPPPVS